MAVIKILEMKQKRKAKDRAFLPGAAQGARIKVLATGCAHCRAMRENTIEAVRRLGLPAGTLACIDDINEIARLGVMVTPSLIIDGRLVSVGKVLKPEHIIDLIDRYMTPDGEEK